MTFSSTDFLLFPIHFFSEFCVTAWITLPTSYLKIMQIEICGNLLVGSTDFFLFPLSSRSL